MSEITLIEVYEGLSARMDTMTDELVRNTRQTEILTGKVASLEKGFEDVTIINGGGQTFTQKRSEFVQNAFNWMKQDGVIDKRFKKCKEECNNLYSSEKQLEKVKKTFETFWTWSTRGVVLLTFVIILIAIIEVDWTKLLTLIR